MKRSMFVASSLMTLILVFTACGGDVATPIVEEVLVTPTPGPALTVEQIGDIFQDALNSGNIDPFTEILADDFVITQDEGPGRDLFTLTGKVAYIARFAGQIAANDQLTFIDLKAEGNKGTGKFSMTADDLTAIGVDKITGTFAFEVSQGKLVKLHIAYDSESVQKLAAALGPPPVTPTPGPALILEQIADIFQEAFNTGNFDPFFEILANADLLASILPAILEMPNDLIKADNDQAIAIDNVHLITMNGDEILENRQILIQDGLIEAIKPAGSPVDEHFQIIEGKGAYLLPGLFDMHVHIWDRKYQSLSLAYGITTVRHVGGWPMVLRWKKELEEGKWLGSNLFVAPAIFNGERYSNPFVHNLVSDPVVARELVRRYKEEGWDFIKVYESLEAEVYEAIIDEAGKLGIPVVCHPPESIVQKDYRRLAACITLEHAEEIFGGPLANQFDDEKLEAVARQLKAMDATVTLTLMNFDHLTQIGSQKQAYVDQLPLEYLNPLVKFVIDNTEGARWLNVSDMERDRNIELNNYFLHILQVLHEHQVNLVLGSDAGTMYTIPGLSTHDEMALFREAGLTPYEILKTGTINAARALGVDDQLGSIQLGKVADLIMVQQNPLSDISVLREPVAVIKRGQWLDQTDLQALKDSAKNPSSASLTIGRLLEHLISK